MNITISRDSWRNPWVWVAVTPVVLGCWAIAAGLGLNQQARKARGDIRDAGEIHQKVDKLRPKLKIFSKLGGVDAIGREFDGLASAKKCAEGSGILERQMERLESPKIKELKNGDVLHRETYQLKSVRVEQVARFIDLAEGGFENVSCYDLTLVNLKLPKQKDRWNVSVYIAYLRK